MIVDIDERSGFCFGVVTAIEKAEQTIADGCKVYCLGDIVHNRVEVQRLEALGLETIRHSALQSLKNSTILIRAHGEPPATYSLARDNNNNIVDATCPVVARLQQKVIEARELMNIAGGQVVILGKKGHAEVVGLAGQVNGNVIVVEGDSDLDSIDFSRPVYLLSQTTQSLELFDKIATDIKLRSNDSSKVTVNDTICRQVANREPHLKEFAQRYDVIIFVSGRKSSNGKVLFDVCKSANPRSYNIEDESELQPDWFEGVSSVGVCGATSTPKWLMSKVAEKIKKI